MSENITVRGVEFKACGCGCGEPVGTRSTYRPGHDARHAGRVAREAVASVLAGDEPSLEMYDLLPSQALRDKSARMAQRLLDKATGKKATKTEAQTGSIKIGRWDYPVRMSNAGKATRNEKRDGSGAWLPVSPNAAANIDWS